LHCKSMPPSPKIPIAPGTRLDGVTKPTRARYVVQRYSVPKPRCPHVKLGGGMCGLTPAHCRCLCMLCQAPMCAQQVCGVCGWGEPAADAKLTPGEPCAATSPQPMRTPIKLMGRVLFGNVSFGTRNLCLPNMEPGGPSYVGGVSLGATRSPKEHTKSVKRVPIFDPRSFDLTPSPTPAGSPAKLPPPTPYPRPAIPRAWLP
jgi:hypothetical protein